MGRLLYRLKRLQLSGPDSISPFAGLVKLCSWLEDNEWHLGNNNNENKSPRRLRPDVVQKTVEAGNGIASRSKGLDRQLMHATTDQTKI